MPPAVMAVPDRISGRAPVRAITWPAITATTMIATAIGRKATPVLTAL